MLFIHFVVNDGIDPGISGMESCFLACSYKEGDCKLSYSKL